MIKVLLFLLCLVFTINVFGQTTTMLSSEDYLKKARDKETAGFVLVGLGGVCIWAAAAKGFDDINIGYNSSANNSVGLLLLGIGLELISIPLFTAARRNNLRAMEVVTSIEFEKLPLSVGGDFNQSMAPVLSVQVRF